MQLPFASSAEADAALEKFFEGVKELRKECRIADVLVVTATNVVFSDGQEGQGMARCSYGNTLAAPLLAAYALGAAKEDMMECIAKHLKPERRTP